MSRTPIARRSALRLLTAGVWLGGPSPLRAEAGPVAAIDRALSAAVDALVSAQSADGAWRSSTYGAMKDGLSLTPPALKALAFGPELAGVARARRLGAGYLIGHVRADGSIDDGPTGLIYPVYSAAMAAIALDRLPVAGAREARDAWIGELRRRQLTADLGWSPEDTAFGGWGYTFGPPRKDEAAIDPPDANLSATLCAVGALRIAGAEADDPAIRAALIFVERCQNWSGGDFPEHEFDDGGFVFSPCDPSRNKAGAIGIDRARRERFASYGGPTADGLRALLRCGRAPEDARMRAALSWLERHFSAGSHPGRFAAIREVEREACFYYYAWSVAHAFRALGLARLRGGRLAWAVQLSQELIRRQRTDGTWSNRFTATKENDPLVATPLALGALGACRLMLA